MAFLLHVFHYFLFFGWGLTFSMYCLNKQRRGLRYTRKSNLDCFLFIIIIFFDLELKKSTLLAQIPILVSKHFFYLFYLLVMVLNLDFLLIKSLFQ